MGIYLQDWKAGYGTINYVQGECGRWDSYGLRPKAMGLPGWTEFTKEIKERLIGQILVSTRYSPIKGHDSKFGLVYNNIQREFEDMEKAGWTRGPVYPGNHCGISSGYYMQMMYLLLHPELKTMLDNLSYEVEKNG